MNTKQTEALKLALEALESCSAGDYSTGHVIHPSFDVDAVNRAIEAIDELAEQPAQQEPKVLMQEIARLHDRIKDLERDVEFLSRPAQRKPLTDEQIDRAIAELGLNYFADAANNRAVLRELCRKAAHGIK